MNINLTLIVQMIVFIVLIWFTMKFVWPMILGPMEERARKIATGLAAAEQGEKELAEARDALQGRIIREARDRANQIIDHAQHRANELVEQAKGAASTEGARIIAAAQQQIELDTDACQGEPASRGGAASPSVPRPSSWIARSMRARTRICSSSSRRRSSRHHGRPTHDRPTLRARGFRGGA